MQDTPDLIPDAPAPPAAPHRPRLIVRNTLANALGHLLQPLLSIVLVPFYIHHLGLEGYGLVGFLAMLVALLGVVTKGMGLAIQREIARRENSPDDRPSLRRLVRTFELGYWALGAGLALVLVLLSEAISTGWVQAKTIPPETVRLCMLLISVRVALALPNTIYDAVFIGTQKQVLGNVLRTISVAIGAVAGVVVVLLTGSVSAFYMADLANTCLLLLMLRTGAGRTLPARKASLPGRFEWAEIRALWRLCLGLIWAQGIGLLVTQTDRLVISKLLPIATLGIYNAGIAGGRLLGLAYGPFLVAVYPQTCQVAQHGDRRQLAADILRNSKVLLTLSLAVGLPISLFAPEILELWTHNAEVVRGATPIMGLYVYGNIFISVASALYQAQTAKGITKYVVQFNTVALVWFPVTCWLLVKHLGFQGAAWAWVAYAGLGWIFHVVVTLGIILKGEGMLVYLRTVALTAAVGLGITLLARDLASSLFPLSIYARAATAMAAGALTLGVGSLLCFGLGFPRQMASLLPGRGGHESR